MSVGMVIMRPTSIVVAGGGSETASIRAAGGVEFSAATSLSLNGVFTADYDDYMIVSRHSNSVDAGYFARLRVSGSDATGSNYVVQRVSANNTSIAGARTTRAFGELGALSSVLKDGLIWHIYGPNIAQPTAWRTIEMSGQADVLIYEQAVTHSLSTAYDGITIYPASGAMTGLVTVFGLAQ